jgi:hypothetical protein
MQVSREVHHGQFGLSFAPAHRAHGNARGVVAVGDEV